MIEIIARYQAGEWQRSIARNIGRSQTAIRNTLLRRGILLRNSKEEWAKNGCINGRISGRDAVESGQLARAAKGVPSTADGILFRSQTEASFYCVMQELGGEPHAHPSRIDLPDGRSYFPDFELGRSILGIPANIPIELKFARNAFYQKNLPKAIEAGAFIVYWNELVEE